MFKYEAGQTNSANTWELFLDGGFEDERSNLCYYMGGVREDPNKIIGIKEYAITWIEAESECEKLNGHLTREDDFLAFERNLWC